MLSRAFLHRYHQRSVIKGVVLLNIQRTNQRYPLSKMTEFWLISAPGEKTCEETWEKFQKYFAKRSSLCYSYKFQIPDLKVGTLDQLVSLSDDLGKLDTFVDQVTRKVVNYLGDVLEDRGDKLYENLKANNGDVSAYITNFKWDPAKYPTKLSLHSIAQVINKQVCQIDADLKTKSAAYNNLNAHLENLEKKRTGTLLTRNLADLVKKEHFILDSEYITTLLVIVPKVSFKEWQNMYETLTDMVVPRSSTLINQDASFGLYSVSLFKKVVDEFKLRAREKKFIVRDFTYNENELAAGKDETAKLIIDKKNQFGPLVRWLKVNFSESFCAWIHVKALRVFVESVLRYGLPVNFQAILLEPNRSSKRLREVLNHLYGHLDSSASLNTDNVEIPGLTFNQADYYPYVYYKLDVSHAVPAPKIVYEYE